MSTKTKHPKPVAWRHDNGPFARIAITHSQKVADHWVGLGWDVTPLYESQPAPAVPTFEERLSTLENKPLGWVRDSMKASYDACRAAMLAQPVSQGCNWIAFSERLPKVGDTVLISSDGYLRAAQSLRQMEEKITPLVASVAEQVKRWAKIRKVTVSEHQAIQLAMGKAITVLDTVYQANQVTGELIVAGMDKQWRKSIAKNKAADLVSRWQALAKGRANSDAAA